MLVHFPEKVLGGCQISGAKRRGGTVGQQMISPQIDATRLTDVNPVEYGFQAPIMICRQHEVHGFDIFENREGQRHDIGRLASAAHLINKLAYATELTRVVECDRHEKLCGQACIRIAELTHTAESALGPALDVGLPRLAKHHGNEQAYRRARHSPAADARRHIREQRLCPIDPRIEQR